MERTMVTRGSSATARGRDRGGDRDDDREERGGRGGASRGGGKSKGGGFSYRGRSGEEVARRAKQSSGRYDSFLTEEVTWYKPHDGENHVRIIPWLNGDDPDFDALIEKWGSHWGIDIIVHRNVGPDNGTYLCNDKMNGEPCPPCDAYRDGEDDLRGSDRVLCWLVDRKAEKSGVQLWAMPLGNSKDISAVSQVKGSGAVLLIDDPEEGYDIYFEREGEKKRTKYKRFEVDRDPSPLHENEKKQADWLEYVTERRLPDLLKFYDAEYLDKVLSGQSSKSEDDEDGGGERSSRRGAWDGMTARKRLVIGVAVEIVTGASSRRGRGGDDGEEEASERPSRRGRGEPEEEAEKPSPRKGAGAGPNVPLSVPAGVAGPKSPRKPPAGRVGAGLSPRKSPRNPRKSRSRARGRRAPGPFRALPGFREGWQGRCRETTATKGAARERLSRVGRRSRG
jgi:hypothetical protein